MLQVRELEAQLTSERQPGAAAASRRRSETGATGDARAAAEWHRKHDALLSRHHQLQQQLLAVRDIHGIEMPLLAGDAAVAGDGDAAPARDGGPTAAEVQATLANVQARQDEAERRMQEVLQRREAAERQRSGEWQRRVDGLTAQVRTVAAISCCKVVPPWLHWLLEVRATAKTRLSLLGITV